MVKRAEVCEPGESLVFIGSLAQFHGVAGISNYSASKGGMDAVMRTLAVELGQCFTSNTPIPRPGLTADFEDIAIYLCRDASSFHTGDTIRIDGGNLAYPPYATH
jgi:NAD(P)-dependent dehydrogenase (short-subunit alcohol dehydrogenase family)